MLVRLGPTDLDPDLRPIVLVVAPSIEGGQPLETWVKQAIGQGADLVEVPLTRLDPATAEAMRDASLAIGVSCERLADVDGALASGAAALRWNGEPTHLAEVRARVGSIPLVVSMPADADSEVPALGPGDWLVVPWEHRERLTERATGVLGLVDLGVRTDRAELAAAVTVALEGDIDGFVTVAPTAVRRAAHVIRAVERTR